MERVFVIYTYTNDNAAEWYDPSAVASTLEDAVQYLTKHRGYRPPIKVGFKVLAIKSGDEIPSKIDVEDSDQMNDTCPSCKSPHAVPTDEDAWLCLRCKTKWPIESVAIVYMGANQKEIVLMMPSDKEEHVTSKREIARP